MHTLIDAAGEVFFSRAANDGDSGHAHHDTYEHPLNGAQNGGRPATEAVGVMPGSFILGEQHYINGKLAFAPHEKVPISPSAASNSELWAPPVKCVIQPVRLEKMSKYVESLESTEDGSTSASVMFAAEMLSYYRPKGRLALLSPFLHVSLVIFSCVPTLALFTYW